MASSREAQVKKYGSEKLYKEEMRRRSQLVKNRFHYFADKEVAKKLSKEGLVKRWGQREKEKIS